MRAFKSIRAAFTEMPKVKQSRTKQNKTQTYRYLLMVIDVEAQKCEPIFILTKGQRVGNYL